MEKPTAPTIDTENLPPVTLETQGNLQVIRWRGMEFFHSRLDNIDWIKSLVGEYVGYSIHLGYFSTPDEIVMLLDPALWEKLRISMASQPGTLVPVDSCSLNGVIIKPYMPHEAAPFSRSGHLYQLQTASRDGVLMVDTSGGYGIVPVTPIPMVEIEKSEYERLLAVEKSYNTLCEEMRSGEKLKDAMCLVFKDAYEVGNSHGHDQMKNYQLDDLFDNYWEERRKERERP